MSRFMIVLFVLALALIAPSACAPAPSAPAPSAPPAVATGGAPNQQSLPSQPTLPPLTPAAPVPFATNTFSPIVVGNPVNPGTPPTLAPTAVPARPATAPTTASAAPANPNRAEVKLDFVTPLGTAELVDDLRDKLVQVAGILAVSGNENAVTVVYNPALISVDQIKQRMAGVGSPVK